MTAVGDALQRVVSGAPFQVVALPHAHLSAFVQNFEGRPALVVRGKLRQADLPTDGRGFTLTSEELDSGPVIRIASATNEVDSVFEKFIEYVLERTSSAGSATKALETLPSAVDEFRNFSGRRPGRLSEDEIRGLVAELSLLERLAEQCLEPTDALTAWKGPFALRGEGRHDFTFLSGRAIEVKSARVPAREVRVSSDRQLRPSNDPLDLAVLPLETVAEGTHGSLALPDLVSRVESLFATAGRAAQERWREALEAAGLDGSDDYYKRWAFMAGEWKRFAVRAGFPAIPSDAIPAGIAKVTYSLELEALGEFAEPFEELLVKGVA